jgi:GT2 family glycosyltransferase
VKAGIDKIAAIIPTTDRPESLAECLRSLAGSALPIHRVLVVDASQDRAMTRRAVEGQWPFKMELYESPVRGSAAQRNLALQRLESEDGVLFIDDDAVVEPDCIAELTAAFDTGAAGIAANIANQPVGRPGLATRIALFLAGSEWGGDLSGRLIGPAVGIRPRADLSERFVPVEWASTTCVLYRRDALPQGGFRTFFSGYSLGEDVALSVDARRNGGLFYATAARIIHTPRRTAKPPAFDYGHMEVLNRYYLSRYVLDRQSWVQRLQFWLWIGWEFLGSLGELRRSPCDWLANWCGRFSAMIQILKGNADG